MRKFINFCLLAVVATLLPAAIHAQNNPIETDANLKDTTTHVVVERKVIETTKTYQQDTPREGSRKAAIFVVNRVGPAMNDKVAVLEDFLTSRITEKGFSVISREVSINALNTTSLDQALSTSSSALRLAQNLGADYLLVASITSFGNEKKTDSNLGTVNVIHTLRVSCKLLEGVQGGSLIADTVKAVKTIRSTENNRTENSDILNDLLDDAATQVAGDPRWKKSTTVAVQSKQVEITVACGMQDMVQMPISIPDVRVLNDSSIFVSSNRLGIQVLDATVEIDGIAIGSAPGQFKVPSGLSKMRITREGFTPWERTVNCSEGQKFKVALQMSDAGYKRWMETTAFLFGLKTGEKLTDGAVKMMEGFAQTLRQSG